MRFDKEQQTVQTMSGFKITPIPMDAIVDTEYVLFELLLDTSGSTSGWAKRIESLMKTIVTGGKRTPCAQQIFMRVSQFNSSIKEIHGPRKLVQIDPAEYDGSIFSTGATDLYGATLNALEASENYAKAITSKNSECNIVIWIVTDGEHAFAKSLGSPSKINQAIKRIRKDENATSVTTILVGIGISAPGDGIDQALQTFKNDAGLDGYISFDSMSESALMKLTGLISQSLSTAAANVTSGKTAPIIGTLKI